MLALLQEDWLAPAPKPKAATRASLPHPAAWGVMVYGRLPPDRFLGPLRARFQGVFPWVGRLPFSSPRMVLTLRSIRSSSPGQEPSGAWR